MIIIGISICRHISWKSAIIIIIISILESPETRNLIKYKYVGKYGPEAVKERSANVFQRVKTLQVAAEHAKGFLTH